MSFRPARLEAAIARLEALPDASARAAAREALEAVLELHGEGLKRLAERLGDSAQGARLIEAAADDEAVACLLSLHGLHPVPLESRVRSAIGRVRPSDHGGGRVDLVSIVGATVRLRVDGSERLRGAVERAIMDAAPEIEQLDVVASDPSLVPAERLVRKRAPEHSRCELCAEALGPEHEHLFDVERRKLQCACTACAILLDLPTGKLRRVRKQVRALPDLRISEAQWQALEVPVGLAFFCRSSQLAEVIAAYPGPAGAVEAVVPRAAWASLLQDNAVLAELEPDTLALLASRLGTSPTYHLLSIDECYRLTGLVRARWQGLTGGDGPARALRELFGLPAEEAA